MWADSRHWNRFRRSFARAGFSTRAVTLPFHDTPQDLAGLRKVGIRDYVERVRAEIDSEQVILVGHSMGGLVAQKLAESGVARALVLLETCAPAGINPLTPSSFLCLSANLLDAVLSRPFVIPPRNAAYGLTNALSRREKAVIYDSFLYESGRALREIISGAIRVDERKIQIINPGVGSVF
ncbi:MAG: alpha/beta fold hydrolase, partial [Chloroflexota bacterium]